MNAPTAGILAIGNEILSGKVADTNSGFLIRELRALGVQVGRVHVLPDVQDEIALEVRDFSSRFDHVFTTGGVGPTHDDKTMPSIAQAFAVEMVHSKELEGVIARFYGDGVNDYVLRMAALPEGARLLWDGDLPFPVVAVQNVYVFPGDPTFLQQKFLAIRGRFAAEPFCLGKIFTTCEEGELASLLDEAEQRCPGVQVGSYPVYGDQDYSVQVTIESKDREEVQQTLGYVVANIPPERIVRVEEEGGRINGDRHL